MVADPMQKELDIEPTFGFDRHLNSIQSPRHWFQIFLNSDTKSMEVTLCKTAPNKIILHFT